MIVNSTGATPTTQPVKENQAKGAQSSAPAATAATVSDRVELSPSKVNGLEENNADSAVARQPIADFKSAAETANLLKAQILSQPRVAFQAQANQGPQSALRLLDMV